LIKKQISAFYKNEVKIFDSAEVVAQKLNWVLQKENLVSDKKQTTDIFYVSDFTESFKSTTNIFYGKEIHLELNNIWKKE
jgi:glutamate racemase